MSGELAPGATPRRWEPEGGVKKHNERIHRESSFIDKYKDLPFSFSKPTKPKICRIFECGNCGKIISAPKNTVMVICGGCGEASKVKEI